MCGFFSLSCYLFGMGCAALELAGCWVEVGLSIETEISRRALAVWYYMGLGGLWWSNVLNSALLSEAQAWHPARAPRPSQPHGFWEVWGLLPAFSMCSVGVVPQVDVFLMYLWGGRWSPRLTPPPPWMSSLEIYFWLGSLYSFVARCCLSTGEFLLRIFSPLWVQTFLAMSYSSSTGAFLNQFCSAQQAASQTLSCWGLARQPSEETGEHASHPPPQS